MVNFQTLIFFFTQQILKYQSLLNEPNTSCAVRAYVDLGMYRALCGCSYLLVEYITEYLNDISDIKFSKGAGEGMV